MLFYGYEETLAVEQVLVQMVSGPEKGVCLTTPSSRRTRRRMVRPEELLDTFWSPNLTRWRLGG